MAKFLVQDDDGATHEVKFSAISSKSISANDSVIAYYEVGNAEAETTKIVLTQLKALLENILPKYTKIGVIATRNGKKDVDITIVKSKE